MITIWTPAGSFVNIAAKLANTISFTMNTHFVEGQLWTITPRTGNACNITSTSTPQLKIHP